MGKSCTNPHTDGNTYEYTNSKHNSYEYKHPNDHNFSDSKSIRTCEWNN
jgi:hypothetical protein